MNSCNTEHLWKDRAGRTSPLCNLCCKDDEDVEHFILKCENFSPVAYYAGNSVRKCIALVKQTAAGTTVTD